MAAQKTNRTRNWVMVVYPESAPDNWRDIIDEEHITWVESPLHDKDVDPDGVLKKSHWHVLLMYEGPKSYDQVKSVSDALNAPAPQMCSAAKGTVRYMVHMDHPDKYQYDKSLIIGHGGADVADLLKPTSSMRYVLIREMAQFVRDNRITEYKDLFYYAMQYRFDDWFPLLCDSSTYVLSELIRSYWHEKRSAEESRRQALKDDADKRYRSALFSRLGITLDSESEV